MQNGRENTLYDLWRKNRDKMKEEIRREIKEKRNSLSKSEILEKSNRIKKRLFEQAEFRKAQTILFYVSYGSEFYTHDMIKESL